VRDFCSNEGIHPSTFYYWLKKHREKSRPKEFIPLNQPELICGAAFWEWRDGQFQSDTGRSDDFAGVCLSQRHEGIVETTTGYGLIESHGPFIRLGHVPSS